MTATTQAIDLADTTAERLVEDLREVREIKRDAERQEAKLKALLLDALGVLSADELAKVRAKAVTVTGVVADRPWVRVTFMPTAYLLDTARLRRDLPDLAQQYTTRPRAAHWQVTIDPE